MYHYARQLEVDITAATSDEGIFEVTKEVCSALAKKNDQVEAIMARLVFIGKTDLSSDALEDTSSGLIQLIAEYAEGLTPKVIIESTHDRTVSKIDLQALAQEDGFLKELFETSKRMSENPDLKKELLQSLVSELVKKGWHTHIDSEMDPRAWSADSDTLSELIAEAQELVCNMFLQMSSNSK